MDNAIAGNEYMNFLYHGSNHFLTLTSLISFIGARHIISDFYDHRPDILCNPFVKIIVLFSVIYMNLKNIKMTILIFFIYIFLIDNYVFNDCSIEYIANVKGVEITMPVSDKINSDIPATTKNIPTTNKII
jgi:hypothetical protein